MPCEELVNLLGAAVVSMVAWLARCLAHNVHGAVPENRQFLDMSVSSTEGTDLSAAAQPGTVWEVLLELQQQVASVPTSLPSVPPMADDSERLEEWMVAAQEAARLLLLLVWADRSDYGDALKREGGE
jgi:hypothetical protein